MPERKRHVCFDVSLVERLSCTCRTVKKKKKCHLVLGTEGAGFFFSSGISASIYFCFIYFSWQEALCQHHRKWETGGQAKASFWKSALNGNAAPPSVPPHLFTVFSILPKSNDHLTISHFRFCPHPSPLPFSQLLMYFVSFFFFCKSTPPALQDGISISGTLSCAARSGAAQARCHIIEIICVVTGEPRYSWNWIAGCCLCCF